MTEVITLNDTSDRPIRLFNPGTLQSDDEIVRQFVVRQSELDIALEIIRCNINAPSCQHLLVVGPRGRGKTMLLARVCAELRMNNKFAKHLFPVRFMEESHEIITLADFWFEALLHLAHAKATVNPEFSQELLATHADLITRWSDTNIAEQVHAVVLDAAIQMGKTLVLMVENLQSLCADADIDFGWQLRKTLQTEPQIMLLATATSQFNGLNDASQPFFELFRIINLEPLDNDACRRLWCMVSGDNSERRDIRPLRILTGGDPRLLGIVAMFAKHQSLHHLLEELVSLVDDHTEYFRSHLEVIGKTERRVYIAILDLWQPSSPSEIAARSRLDIRTVSTMLGRLVNRGVVLVDGTGRKRQYSAAARLYSIYYKLRHERGEASLVQHLIQFMTTFYSDDELTECAKLWHMEAMHSPTILEGIQLALAEWFVPDNLMQIVNGQADSGEVDQSSCDNTTVESRKQALTVLIDTANMYRKNSDHKSEVGVWQSLVDQFGESDTPEIKEWVVNALVNKGFTHHELGENVDALASWEAAIERFGDCGTTEIQINLSHAIFNSSIILSDRGELDAALTASQTVIDRFGNSEDLKLKEQVGWALVQQVLIHFVRGEIKNGNEAIETVEAWVSDSGTPELAHLVAFAMLNLSDVYRKRGEHEAAMTACQTVIDRFSNKEDFKLKEQTGKALLQKAMIHHDRGEIKDGDSTLEAVVTWVGDSGAPEFEYLAALAILNKSAAYLKRGANEAALAACETMINRYGNRPKLNLQKYVAMAMINKTIAYQKRGEHKNALTVCEAVIDRFGDSKTIELQTVVATALKAQGHQQFQMGLVEEALHTTYEIERRFGGLTKNVQLAFEVWLARLHRTHALLVLGKGDAAMDVFRVVCAMFVDSNKEMLHEIISHVPALMAAGASAHDLADMLSTEKQTTDALTPLVVALHQIAGEPVRASVEVLEVAADVRKRIEEYKTV